MAGLRNKFEEVRKLPPEIDLEVLRQNYFIQAKMHGSDDPSIGGLVINTSGRKGEAVSGRAKKKNTTEDFLLFRDFINDLERKYGQDFAENWAAELLDEETYDELMRIEDQDERREAIAEAFIAGIEDGTIDPSSLDDVPDLKEWLNCYSQRPHRTAQHIAKSSETDHELTTDGSEESALDDLFAGPSGEFTPS